MEEEAQKGLCSRDRAVAYTGPVLDGSFGVYVYQRNIKDNVYIDTYNLHI